VKAAGVWYDEFSNLTGDIPVLSGGPLGLPDGATATRWADGLTVIDAEVLAEYDHPHFGRWPAITTRRHGEGRITCVGTVPGRELARAFAQWLAPTAVSGWRDLPASVTATTGTAPDGRRVHVVHNWSWEPARVTTPVPLSDVLNGGPAATALELGPWDVRVLVQALPQA
jgi:beta-galactosidase